ncbi:MAG: TetR/AcrR family transcriptional regulator [Amphiplicatus sp.]
MSESAGKISRRDRKRAEIVAVAEEVFFNAGYAGASMAEIAARVGGSKGTLYNHFRSKEELLLAVIAAVQARRTPQGAGVSVEDATRDEGAFRGWLRRLGADNLARLTSYELLSLQRLAAAEATRMPEVGRACYEGGVAPVFAKVSPMFAAAMERGVIRRAPPRQAAEHFMELCLGWRARKVLWGLEDPPSAEEIAAQVETAVAVFMNGYATR